MADSREQNQGVEAPAGFTQVDDIQVFSSTEKPEEIKEALSSEEKPDLSKAASDLGKKGGEAAAKARARAAEEAEVTAEAKPDEEAQPEDEKPKPHKGNPRRDPVARIAQLNRERAELLKRTQDYEAYIERLESLDAQLSRKPSGAPKQEDFENYDDWVLAVAEHKAAQKAEELLAKKVQEFESERQAGAYAAKLGRAVDGYADTVRKYEQQHPGFVESIGEFADSLVPSFALPEDADVGPENVVADEIFSSAHAPALMLYLSEHPEELDRLADLPTPRAIAREIAKLEARLDAAAPAPRSKPESSKAPKPLSQVKGAPHTAETPPGDDASFEEHQRYWDAYDRKRRSAGR